MSKICTGFGHVVRKLIEGVSLVTLDMCELDADSVRFCIVHQCSCGSGNPSGFHGRSGLACGWVSRTCAVIVNRDWVPRFASLGQCPLDCLVQGKSFRGFCRLRLQSMLVPFLWEQRSSSDANNELHLLPLVWSEQRLQRLTLLSDRPPAFWLWRVPAVCNSNRNIDYAERCLAMN